MELLFKIGFIDVKFVDIIDILLVGFLLFQLYKLLRGGLAFNIFIGLLFVYIVWQLVQALNMKLLSALLGQFINVGVIALIIVFQPEIRRFLLYIGKGSLLRGHNNFFRNFFTKQWKVSLQDEDQLNEIGKAIDNLVKSNIGAIIVFAKDAKLQMYVNTGVIIEGIISNLLLENIFNKTNPMHDGAVIIAENKIIAAKCILPLSENTDLPPEYGLRHRAAIGITESTDAIVVIVSEEKNQIHIAKEGTIISDLKIEDMKNILRKELFEHT